MKMHCNKKTSKLPNIDLLQPLYSLQEDYLRLLGYGRKQKSVEINRK